MALAAFSLVRNVRSKSLSKSLQISLRTPVSGVREKEQTYFKKLGILDQYCPGMGLDSKSTGIGIAIGIILAWALFMLFAFLYHRNTPNDLEEAKGKVSSQRHQIETLRSDLEETTTRLNENANTIRINKNVISRQTDELRDMNSLRGNVNTLQNQVAGLNRHVERLETSNRTLQEAEGHLTLMRRDLLADVTRLEPFEREASNLRTQVQDLERERQTLLRRQEEAALKLRTTEQTVETLRERYQYVNEQVAEKDLRLQTSLAEIESLRGSAVDGGG